MPPLLPPSAATEALVVFARAAPSELPEEHASRRERFAELETLQAGWQVELRTRPGVQAVEALFFSPAGEEFKSYAEARRAALKARSS